MSDLRERFKALDALEPPDLQQEILTRRRGPAPALDRQQRLVAGILAGLVAVLGIAVGGWALLRLRETSRPVTEPTPGVTAPLKSTRSSTSNGFLADRRSSASGAD